MRTELERWWTLGCTTWLSPAKMPSAKINTARMMVSAGKREDSSPRAGLPDDTGANDQAVCLTIRGGNAQLSACLRSPPQVDGEGGVEFVLVGSRPMPISPSFSGLLSSACKTCNPPLPTQSPEQ